jgi:hypothetical protein
MSRQQPQEAAAGCRCTFKHRSSLIAGGGLKTALCVHCILNLAACTHNVLQYSSTTAVRVCTCMPRVRMYTHAAYMY